MKWNTGRGKAVGAICRWGRTDGVADHCTHGGGGGGGSGNLVGGANHLGFFFLLTAVYIFADILGQKSSEFFFAEIFNNFSLCYSP